MNICEDSLVFTAEMLLLLYISTLIQYYSTPRNSPVYEIDSIILINTAYLIQESLIGFLREPLRHRKFRNYFNKHFREHPNDQISTLGVELLDIML